MIALPKAEVLGEGLTREQWLVARESGIGASEIAAVLGISPFSTPIELYLIKRGEIDGPDESESMYWGSVLEQPVREAFIERTGILAMSLPPITLYRSTELPIALASPDGLVFEFANDSAEPVAWYEGKTADSRLEDHWADGVPVHYEAQAQYQLAVSGLPRNHVGVLIGGNRFRHYVIEADELVGADLFAAAEKFWDRICNGNMPDPDDRENTRRALTHRSGELVDEIELDEAFLSLWHYRHELDAEKKNLERKITGIDNQILKAMDDHKVARVGDQKIASQSTIAGGHVEYDREPYRRLTVANPPRNER